MSNVNSVNTSANSLNNSVNLQDIGLNAPGIEDAKKSDQNEFLQLFVAQLKNQNPLEPEEGSAFLAQLAQFSMVEGIKNMEQGFQSMADSFNSTNALQASSLVGKQVEVKTDSALYTQGQALNGTVDLPSSVTDLIVKVSDKKGVMIKELNLGHNESGDVKFKFDGLDENGDPLNSAVLRINASATIDGKKQDLTTYIASNVDSVTMSGNGKPLLLNVDGFGQVGLEDIKAIR